MQIPIHDTYRNKIICYFFLILFSFIILLAYNILLANIFLPEEYGKYKFVLSFLTLTALVFDGGLFTASAYDLANSTDSQRQILGTIILLTTIISIFFTLFIFLSTRYIDILLNKNVKEIIIVVLYFVFIIPFHEIINYIFQGLHKIFYLAFYKVAPRFLALGVVFFFRKYFALEQGVSLVLAIDLLCGTVFIVSLLLLCKPSFNKFKAHSASLIRKINQFGFKIYIATLFHEALSHAIIVIISLFLSLNAVGIYTATIVICTPVFLTGKSFGVVLYKYFAANSFVKKKIVFALSSILAVEVLFLHFFRFKIVTSFFSEHYYAITAILPLISISLAFQSISRLFYVYFTANGRGQPCLYMNVFFGLSFIVFVLTLAPIFNLMGVALSLLLASIIAMMVAIFYARNKFI